MNGQISLFDKKTNFDVLMSCQSPEQFFRLFDNMGYGCMQNIEDKSIDKYALWNQHCRKSEYCGENGCNRCKMEFLKAEYIEKQSHTKTFNKGAEDEE